MKAKYDRGFRAMYDTNTGTKSVSMFVESYAMVHVSYMYLRIYQKLHVPLKRAVASRKVAPPRQLGPSAEARSRGPLTSSTQCNASNPLANLCDDVGGSAKALCQAGSIQRTKLNMTGRQRQVSNLAVPPPRNLLADLHAKLAKA